MKHKVQHPPTTRTDRSTGRLVARLIVILLLGNCRVFGATADGITVLHEFAETGADGLEPQGTLLFASDAALYGTTHRGGKHGQGVIFKLSLKTNQEAKAYQVLHHFSVERSNGRSPGGPLAEGKDGAIYGTTSLGGAGGLGTVFKINKDGKGFKIVLGFTGIGGDGRVSFAGVRQTADGAWIGTTDEGGQFGFGTVYRVNSDGTGYRVLHHFGGKFRSDGEKPRGTLCEGSDGRWYGVTVMGGRDDSGTVFGLNADGTGYRVLAAFTGTPHDVARPFGNLLEATDGRLYGTSVAGGRGAQGTVFRVGKIGGLELLRSFTGLSGDGRNPYSGLTRGPAETLYGVTLGGGPQGGGLIFQIALDGSGYKTVYAFSEKSAAGRGPYAGLTPGPDGSLYGTTESGSPRRAGVVFRWQAPP